MAYSPSYPLASTEHKQVSITGRILSASPMLLEELYTAPLIYPYLAQHRPWHH